MKKIRKTHWFRTTLLVLIACFGKEGIWFSWVAAQALALAISFVLYQQAQHGRRLAQ